MIHTFHISLTIIVTHYFSSAIDPAPGARSKLDEKSGITIMVAEIMRGDNHSQYGKVLCVCYTYWELHPMRASIIVWLLLLCCCRAGVSSMPPSSWHLRSLVRLRSLPRARKLR
eukprot:4717279-Prymnesium_polylepis.1